MPECCIEGCESQVRGLQDGWEMSRGLCCQDCIDYNEEHGHWPDEDPEVCVECLLDDGHVRHECPANPGGSVIMEPGSECGHCGEEADRDA